MAQDPRPILDGIKKDLDRNPDANGLKAIRDIFDAPAFLAELSSYLAEVNDPDIRAEVLDAIIGILRKCTDRSAERKNQLTNVRYGIGGGIALTASGLIGMVTGGAGLVIAVFAGIWMAAMAVGKTGPLAAEEQIYTDIGARMTKIREKLDVV